ncbi:hypothetical protein EDC04DRAFT_2700036 [Pisolithus marmoratus]|nr:hypothetical protein EDC04DRAFT_2700036 [Pisolithus marmoratus]
MGICVGAGSGATSVSSGSAVFRSVASGVGVFLPCTDGISSSNPAVGKLVTSGVGVLHLCINGGSSVIVGLVGKIDLGKVGSRWLSLPVTLPSSPILRWPSPSLVLVSAPKAPTRMRGIWVSFWRVDGGLDDWIRVSMSRLMCTESVFATLWVSCLIIGSGLHVGTGWGRVLLVTRTEPVCCDGTLLSSSDGCMVVRILFDGESVVSSVIFLGDFAVDERRSFVLAVAWLASDDLFVLALKMPRVLDLRGRGLCSDAKLVACPSSQSRLSKSNSESSSSRLASSSSANSESSGICESVTSVSIADSLLVVVAVVAVIE